MADRGMNRLVQHLLQAARGRAGGELTDGQLLECFLARREDVLFEAIVQRHGPMVLGVCRRVLRHAEDAEDAFQATFLVLARKGSGIRPRDKVGNWLYGVAYRIALKSRAARLKRQARETTMDTVPDSPAPTADPAGDWLPLLDRELHALPAKYRAPIVLCHLQGKTQVDASRQLGWPEGTLSGRLSRARALLCLRLNRRGITLAVGALTAALPAETALATVPAALVETTVKAAGFITLKQAVSAGVISARAAFLAEGVLKAMMWNKLKAGVVGVLALMVVATGLGRALYTASGQSKAPASAVTKVDEPKAGKVEGSSGPAKDLNAKLRKHGQFTYEQDSLKDVLNTLRNGEGINIVFEPGPAEENVAPAEDFLVNLKLNDVPLETALRYILRPVKLGFVNQDGILVISPMHKAMVRKVYSVGALLGGDEEKNAPALIQTIINTIESDTWTLVSSGLAIKNPMNANIFAPGNQLGGGGGILGGAGQFGMFGGNQFGMMGAGPPPPAAVAREPSIDANASSQGASIAYFPGTKALVVRQYPEAHREIEELLMNLATKE